MEEKLLHLYEKYGSMDFVQLEKDGLMNVSRHEASNKIVKLTVRLMEMIPMVIYGQLRFEDNVLHGIGRIITFLGDLGNVLVLEGQFVDGKLNGFGRRLKTDNSCYIGFYKNSWRWGYGRANYVK